MTENDIVAGIINTFMQSNVPAADAHGSPHAQESGIHKTSASIGSNVYSDDSEGGEGDYDAGESYKGGKSSFADFSGGKKSKKFDPDRMLKQYEINGGSNHDGSDSDSSDSDVGYVDIGAKRIGKPPRFPDDPINTNVRVGGDDYTDGDRRPKQKRRKRVAKQRRSNPKQQPHVSSNEVTFSDDDRHVKAEYDFEHPSMDTGFSYNPEM
ncbi:MAG: hypothetical protein PHN45_00885 [Methylococcales bacterium]|nr:hypothetical protein [Methylococcales bacterium]